MNRLIDWFGPVTRPRYGRIWLLFFIYPLLVALLVQLVILPYVFPAWNAGEGMLAGGDWYAFHQAAVKLADQIHVQGWSAWELRPHGQAPVGIAAAIYALTIPKPWALIPLSAALHATAAMILLLIVGSFLPNWRKVFLAVLPFWLFPSAMIWYTQIHKDGYFILGFLLFVYGWLNCFQLDFPKSLRYLPGQFLLMFSGMFLIWVVRPYALDILQGVAVIAWVLTAATLILRCVHKKRIWYLSAIRAILLGVVVSVIQPQTIQSVFELVTHKSVGAASDTLITPTNQLLPSIRWNATGWPEFIESRAGSLAESREGYRLFGGASNVDVNVSFHNVNDIIRYMPRAMELAFLAPFPPDWFGQGSLAQNTIMRRVSAFEMIGIYIGLALLPLAIWRWWRKPELWIVLIFCTGMMLIYALVTTNIGTLYRFRYGFIMTLVAIGIAGGLSFWKERKKQAKV